MNNIDHWSLERNRCALLCHPKMNCEEKISKAPIFNSPYFIDACRRWRDNKSNDFDDDDDDEMM